MKISTCFFFSVLMGLCVSVNAANWTRSGHLAEKEWNGSKSLVFGFLRSPPANSNNCSGDDLAVEFDISVFARLAGTSFDVNKIYVDGVTMGEVALDIWLTDWQRRGYGRRLVALGDNPYDWKNYNKVYVCVGLVVQTAVVITTGLTLDSLESVILWYDGPVGTTKLPFPKEKPVGDPMDMGDEADALAVSGNGNIIASFNGSGVGSASTEAPTPNLPNFIVNRNWLETVGGVEQYVYAKTDEIKMKAQFRNIGQGEIPNDAMIHSRAYLSKGLKEDAHNEWTRVGTDETRGDSLDVGETHTETEGLKLWEYSEIEPGKTYNIVWCIDRTADQNNGSGDWQEEHESDNCSTEAVFTVSGNFDFRIDSVSLDDGKTSLAPGEVFGVDIVAYNAGDNAPRDTRVGYYLSGGSMPNPVIIGTSAIKEENFASGVSKSEMISGVAAPTEPGTYSLLVCTDYDNRIQETNENNNCLSVSVPVIGSTPPPNPAPKKASPAVLKLLYN